MSTKATPDHSESESEVDEEEPPKILQEISHTQPDIVCKVRLFQTKIYDTYQSNCREFTF